MPFTIEDFGDLVRLLGEHPEWQAELRRQVLSEELLELPALVRQLAEAQARTEQRLTELTEAQARTEQRLTELAEAQQRTEQQLTALAEAQQRTEQRLIALAEAQGRTEQRLIELIEAQARTDDRLARIEAGLERLEAAVERLAEAQGRTETRVGQIEGDLLELRYARRGPAYLSRVARRLRLMDTGVLADMPEDAVHEGRLTEAESQAVLDTDLVFSGVRREDNAEIYVLAEVSSTVDHHDIERAADRAALLEKLGRPVTPVVAGRRIDSKAVEMAGDRGVWHALDGRVSPPQRY